MRKTGTALRVIGIVSLFVLVTLPACGSRRMAVERHQQTQRIKALDIERRELELKCLRRNDADARVDCSQFQRSANPTPATAPPASATPTRPAPATPAQ